MRKSKMVLVAGAFCLTTMGVANASNDYVSSGQLQDACHKYRDDKRADVRPVSREAHYCVGFTGRD